MHIFKSISWTFIGNIAIAISKWLILIMVIRFLEVELVGEYTFALALTAPIFLFANMRLRQLYVVTEFNFSYFVKSRVLITFFSLLFTTLFCLIFYNEYFITVMLVAFIKVMELQSELYLANLHKRENFTKIGKIQFVKSLIVISIFVSTLAITDSLYLSLSAQFATLLLYFLLFELKLSPLNLEPFKHNHKVIIDILKMGIPLGIVQVLTSLVVSFPKYFLEFSVGIESVAYFTSIAYILTIGELFMSAVSSIFLPKLNRLIEKKDIKQALSLGLIKINLLSVSISLMFIIMVFLFGEEILLILYGNPYDEYQYILKILSLGILFNYLSWSGDTLLLAVKEIRIQTYISIFLLITNVPLMYMLISTYGIAGAAYSLVIANFFQGLLKIFFAYVKTKKLMKEG